MIDDQVLLTSANLTGYAFKKRHEVGTVLTGSLAKSMIALYLGWWNKSLTIQAKNIPVRKHVTGDEPHGPSLPDLWTLPKPPESTHKASGKFRDYEYFLDVYKQFVKDYLSCGPRDFSGNIPIYFETDLFLNFLFRAGDKGSRPYQKGEPRHLSHKHQLRDIARWRKLFGIEESGEEFHSVRSRLLVELLNKDKIMHLSMAEIKQVAESLNCFAKFGIARDNFIKKNSLGKMRMALHHLIHGDAVTVRRMEDCKSALRGFGTSAIQEVLAYHSPEKYPLKNLRVDAGMRFLGYGIRAR